MADSRITVDAHQHYWELWRFEYSWHKQQNEPRYNRDYMPEEHIPQMQATGIRYSVVIQADFSIEETLWLLELKQRYPHIAGVVGWVDLAAPDSPEAIARLAPQEGLKSIRPLPLPAPDGDWTILQPGLRALAVHGLACDLLIDGTLLPKTIELIRANPQTRFVINHMAGLPLTPGGVPDWREQLRPLAALPNVAFKVSAYLSLAEPPPLTPETLRPYVESALELFGPERLMFASDWPVSTLSGSYAENVGMLRAVTDALSSHEQACIWGETANTVYNLKL